MASSPLVPSARTSKRSSVSSSARTENRTTFESSTITTRTLGSAVSSSLRPLLIPANATTREDPPPMTLRHPVPVLCLIGLGRCYVSAHVRLPDPRARAEGRRREELAPPQGCHRASDPQRASVRRGAVRQLPVQPQPRRPDLVLLASAAAHPGRRRLVVPVVGSHPGRLTLGSGWVRLGSDDHRR